MATIDDILYRSGGVFLPKPIHEILDKYYVGSDSSLTYFTNWSLLHFFSGIVIGYFIRSYLKGFLIHTIWELWQILIRSTPLTSRGFIDIGVDTGMFMLGMVLFTGNKYV